MQKAQYATATSTNERKALNAFSKKEQKRITSLKVIPDKEKIYFSFELEADKDGHLMIFPREIADNLRVTFKGIREKSHLSTISNSKTGFELIFFVWLVD